VIILLPLDFDLLNHVVQLLFVNALNIVLLLVGFFKFLLKLIVELLVTSTDLLDLNLQHLLFTDSFLPLALIE
jgi:hypothetical protein